VSADRFDGAARSAAAARDDPCENESHVFPQRFVFARIISDRT